MTIQVQKYSGDLVPFSEKSLRQSLLNSGASKEDAAKVYDLITKDLYEGIPTKELYEKAFKALKELRHSVAARLQSKTCLTTIGTRRFLF